MLPTTVIHLRTPPQERATPVTPLHHKALISQITHQVATIRPLPPVATTRRQVAFTLERAPVAQVRAVKTSSLTAAVVRIVPHRKEVAVAHRRLPKVTVTNLLQLQARGTLLLVAAATTVHPHQLAVHHRLLRVVAPHRVLAGQVTPQLRLTGRRDPQ
jgi:hypothetical protein